MATRTDAELRAVTGDLRGLLNAGADVDAVVPRAFAAVREAARRTLGQRHVDEQIAAGAALVKGALVEMRSGEGKTLTATLPAYVAGLSGSGVHVLTASDHLAHRDLEWMAPIFRFLGLTCGLVVGATTATERRTAYAADVTYGGWEQFGYDYLRDTMAWSAQECVQRGQVTAIVDEADLVMIDQAMTPLIISTPSDRPTARYAEFAAFADRLVRDDDYEVREHGGTVSLLEQGIGRAERELGVDNLYDPPNAELLGHLTAALHAKELLHRGRDYFVQDGEILIVDAFTGQAFPGRRYAEDTHAAVEAKEGLAVGALSQTLTKITVWSYLSRYARLSGMAAVASTEARAYKDTYNLEVVSVPPHRPVLRTDRRPRLYANGQAHLAAVVDAVTAHRATGRPVLIGAASIVDAERLSRALTEQGIDHDVSSGEHHDQEAELIAQAGRPGAITIVTAWGGLGVDIPLGGRIEADRERVVALGGLYVLGTSLYPVPRLEPKLRGRAGRRGDPGESEFFLNLLDPPVRTALGANLADHLIQRIDRGQTVDVVSANRVLAMAADGAVAQKINALKRAVAWDAVEAEQRAELDTRRRAVLDGHLGRPRIRQMIDEVIAAHVERPEPRHEGAGQELWTALRILFPVSVTPRALADAHGCSVDAIPRAVLSAELRADAQRAYDRRESELGAEITRELETRVALCVIDKAWREHLPALQDAWAAAGMQALARRDPLAWYRREATVLYRSMLDSIKEATIGYLFNLEVTIEPAGAEETA